MSFSRHTIREAAFQTLFALASSPELDRERLYHDVLPLAPEEEPPAYLLTLVNGVQDNQAALDARIEGALASGWTLDRLARPDLVILRLALYELQYEEGVPTAVAINEALQLARSFSDDRSRKFINGVLSNLGSTAQ